MSEADALPEKKKLRSRKLLIAALAATVLGGAGFATTYAGLWSPGTLIASRSATPLPDVTLPAVAFVAIPAIEVVVPSPGMRSLVVHATIETDAVHQAMIEHLMPRILDVFTTFLSGVDPRAYERRGVLEVIRAELVTRLRVVLGDEPVHDLLITEFRFK
ncbi:MAG: flagellar basal body-associated FliL family protein [Paracoccus sp. (in: a-proteobacteria)]|nr:flagellar basal body-associated FliL family protein [Paracoccus sp. (in: a-proteobacteria)]